jgi:dTDP-glucose 4,6-dehydratase
MLALSYFHAYGLPVIIVRAENNYGAWQDAQKAIPTFIRKALANEKLPVYGDGKHHRMWIRVEDTCDAINFIMQYGKAGEIFNIGGQQERENLFVAKTILRILNKPESLIEFIPDHDIRPGHDRRYAMDISKLNDLGWKPVYNFDGGIEHVVNWYKQNQWWLK